MSFFLPATLAILQDKMAKGHKFIAEERQYNPTGESNQVIWVSDFRGSFELETIVSNDNDWHSIQFEHDGKAYCAEVNVYFVDGILSVAIHSVSGEAGEFQVNGSEFIKIEITKNIG